MSEDHKSGKGGSLVGEATEGPKGPVGRPRLGMPKDDGPAAPDSPRRHAGDERTYTYAASVLRFMRSRGIRMFTLGEAYAIYREIAPKRTAASLSTFQQVVCRNLSHLGVRRTKERRADRKLYAWAGDGDG